MRVTVSVHATKDSDERLFPVSKHRSRRIHKKLLKRFGGEFRKVPCAYQTPEGIIMHPTLYTVFKNDMSEQARRTEDRMFFRAIT